MLKNIVRMFMALNNNSPPGEIAHAFACGLILGFMPKNSLLWTVFFIFFFFLRINKGTLLLSIALFSLLAPLADSFFDTIGYAILMRPEVQEPFRSLLNIPFVAFTRFNNSIVMGSLLVSLALYVPAYLLMRVIIFQWRKKLSPMLANNIVLKSVQKLPLVQKIISIVAGLDG